MSKARKEARAAANEMSYSMHATTPQVMKRTGWAEAARDGKPHLQSASRYQPLATSQA